MHSAVETRIGGRRASGHRVLLLLAGAVAAAGIVSVVLLSTSARPAELTLAERYAAAWAAGDYSAMYRSLSDAARERVTLREFVAAHRAAMATATATGLAVAGAPELHERAVRVPFVVRTRLFGELRLTAVLPLRGADGTVGIEWRDWLAFPGMPPGAARLERETRLPPRAALLARDGRTLAAGPVRLPEPAVADIAAETVGQVGPPPTERARELAALGVPRAATAGLTGLERALDERLIGRPGGRLLAGGTVLARSRPREAAPVRTTISPRVQRAAVAALAGRVGGIVALDPRSGEVLAFAGIAFTGLQPPGSTFKIVTLTGALEAGVARPSDDYPVKTATTLAGVALENAHGEECGGSLAASFAHSCNSVFAPMGAELGAERLLDVARRFGFNSRPDIPGAATPTIPERIGDDLAVGSTAIGQGQAQATALTMASIAATIARDGRRPRLTLSVGRDPGPPAPVTSPAVARTVGRMMLRAVRAGTGTAASIPGVAVAGKTGTAELEPTQGGPELATDTDAWFAAYAPAGRPKVAVGVMLYRNGMGGETAAPAARQVLLAALGD
jgi:peptidoglycan glycosyltransferase